MMLWNENKTEVCTVKGYVCRWYSVNEIKIWEEGDSDMREESEYIFCKVTMLL